MNNQLDNLAFELKNLEKMVYLYEKEPEKQPNMSMKEREKRLKRMQDTITKLQDLQRETKITLSE